MHSAETYTIRQARDDDEWALRWLAALDSQRPLTGPALIGEIDAIPAAAISLTDGRVAADPFQTTLAVRELLLRARASALRSHASAPRSRRKRLAGALALVVILAGTALVPTAASAAQPKVGLYAGKTSQPSSMPFTGSIKLKVIKLGGYKLAKVSARMKMDCQGDPARIETFRVAVPVESGKVSGSGRFSYRVSTSPTSGFSVSGRFVSRTKASGTFGRSDSSTGCYVGNVRWTASLV